MYETRDFGIASFSRVLSRYARDHLYNEQSQATLIAHMYQKTVEVVQSIPDAMFIGDIAQQVENSEDIQDFMHMSANPTGLAPIEAQPDVPAQPNSNNSASEHPEHVVPNSLNEE